jgi:hypothetical protein
MVSPDDVARRPMKAEKSITVTVFPSGALHGEIDLAQSGKQRITARSSGLTFC